MECLEISCTKVECIFKILEEKNSTWSYVQGLMVVRIGNQIGKLKQSKVSCEWSEHTSWLKRLNAVSAWRPLTLNTRSSLSAQHVPMLASDVTAMITLLENLDNKAAFIKSHSFLDCRSSITMRQWCWSRKSRHCPMGFLNLIVPWLIVSLARSDSEWKSKSKLREKSLKLNGWDMSTQPYASNNCPVRILSQNKFLTRVDFPTPAIPQTDITLKQWKRANVVHCRSSFISDSRPMMGYISIQLAAAFF